MQSISNKFVVSQKSTQYTPHMLTTIKSIKVFVEVRRPDNYRNGKSNFTARDVTDISSYVSTVCYLWDWSLNTSIGRKWLKWSSDLIFLRLWHFILRKWVITELSFKNASINCIICIQKVCISSLDEKCTDRCGQSVGHICKYALKHASHVTSALQVS